MISRVRVIRWALLLFLTLGLAIAIGHPSYAQLNLPDSFGTKSSLAPPTGVSRYGSIEVATVRSPIDGRDLLVIASPTVYDRGDREKQTLNPAVETRAKEVEARLFRAIVRPMDRKTLQVEVSRLNNVTIIDARDKQFTRPLVLVSVTEEDADYHGQPIDELAQEWRAILDLELQRGLQRFSVEELFRSLGRTSQTLLALLTFATIVILIKYGLSLSQKRLRRRKQEITEHQSLDRSVTPEQSPPPTTDRETQSEARNIFLQRLQQTLSLDRRLGFLNFVQWLLFWLLIVGFYLAIYRIFRQIPLLARYSSAIAGKPIELLSIWFLTGLGLRLSGQIIDRLKRTWQEHEFLSLGDAQRRMVRASTIAGATKGLTTVIILSMGILAALNILGVPTGSVLAIGGLLGLAISFGSQSLVKDLVNGCLILAEDQFAVGDVIDLGEVSGLVENLNLRVTQIRSADGELITVPNSAITEVKNLTRTWSRVNFTIDVAYQTDPEKALDVLRQVCQNFYNDPNWHDKAIAPPDVLGIDSISHRGMTISIWIQTLPAQQWAVGREFRLRVRQALEANGIEIGVPRLDNTFTLPLKMEDGQRES